MEKIIRVHFDKLDEALLAQAMQAFYWLRSIDSIEKKPSTSELVDWLRALPARRRRSRSASQTEIPFAGVLLKKDKDITAMQRRAMAVSPCLSDFSICCAQPRLRTFHSTSG